MKLSYDYSNIITELSDAVENFELLPGETIQILRNDTPIEWGYRPIIDWYYNPDRMRKLLVKELFTENEDEINRLAADYEAAKPALEQVRVADVLCEMERVNSILPYPQRGNLAALRLAAGLRQKDAADILDIDISTYQRYESGQTKLKNISKRRLAKMSKLLNTTQEYLLENF